jgi:hypothetical protein
MTAGTLSRQRCHHHPGREAVARCPECRQFFCRECIAEHDDRVLCAACLKRLAQQAGPRRRRLAGAWRAVQLVAGVLAVWVFFYLAGRLLLAIPASFHEGTLWHQGWWEEE